MENINFDLVRVEKTIEFLEHKILHLEALINRLIEHHPRLAAELEAENEKRQADQIKMLISAGVIK